MQCSPLLSPEVAASKSLLRAQGHPKPLPWLHVTWTMRCTAAVCTGLSTTVCVSRILSRLASRSAMSSAITPYQGVVSTCAWLVLTHYRPFPKEEVVWLDMHLSLTLASLVVTRSNRNELFGGCRRRLNSIIRLSALRSCAMLIRGDLHV